MQCDLAHALGFGAVGMCSIPCSSSMPLNKAHAGLSSDDVSGGDFHGNSANQLPIKRFNVLKSSKARTNCSQHYTVSGTSSGSSAEPSDVLTCPDPNKEVKKMNGLADSPHLPEQPSQSASGNESDDLDILEHDVKVCDICGDAGWEDSLAVCSRCSDGAEHIYCMQQMLAKVPECNWLCEECKFADETEKNTQCKVGMMDEYGGNYFNDGPCTVNDESVPMLDVRGSDVDVNIASNSELKVDRTNKGDQGSQSIRKRHYDNSEVAPAAKRQALDTTTELPKTYSSTGIATSNRDWSFKSSKKGKVKPVHHISTVAGSIDTVSETATSSAAQRVQTPRGSFLKSNSFSTSSLQPKVKLFDEAITQKQKGAREPTKALDTKGGPSRLLGKSMSFKSANPTRPNVTEAKVKMLCSTFSHGQEPKGLKQEKERKNLEKRSSFKLDAPVLSSVGYSSAAVGLNGDQKLTCHTEANLKKRDLKMLHSNGRINSLSKTRSCSENLVGASTSGTRDSAEQKPSQISLKDELCSSSFTAERTVNVSENLQDGLPQLQDSTNQGEKIMANSCSSAGLSVTIEEKDAPCLNGKEVGHAAQSSTIGNSLVSAVGNRSSKEMIDKGSSLKAAIEAAMLKKPGIYRKNKLSNASDELPVSSLALKCETASQDHSSVPGHIGKMISAEERTKGLVLTMISAIPEPEYIWQGVFDLHRNGKPTDLCGGFQAHLSTCASRSVHEVVLKFPEKVSLNEVARLSIWPTHFHDSGAKDDNVALYFFAKDIESYERNYKSLLDRMMKNDLALKGNFDGAELLIFPSNLLPERSQRWNRSFFLWGVFRVKRVSCLDDILCSLKKLPMRSTRENTSAAVMSLPESLCSHGRMDIDSSASEQAHSADLLVNSVKQKQDHGLHSVSLRSPTDNACHEFGGTIKSRQELAVPLSRLDSDQLPQPSGTVRIANEEKAVSSGRGELKFQSNLKEEDSRETEAAVESCGLAGTPFMKEELNCLESECIRGMQRFSAESVPTISSSTTSLGMLWNDWNGKPADRGSISKKQKTGFHETFGSNCSSNASSLGDQLPSSQGADHNWTREKSPPTISDEMDNPKNSVTSERHFFPLDISNMDFFQSASNSAVAGKVLAPADGGRHLDGSPNLELALGAEAKSPRQEILPFLVGIVDKNNIREKCADIVAEVKEEEDNAASLSLSLSFPFSSSRE